MKLIAHRGIWQEKKDANSKEALQKALESPHYIGVECDVRETKDGKFIIYHDPIYQTKLVGSCLYKEFQKNKNIPLLEDVLKIKCDKIYLLEIKSQNIDKQKFFKLLKKYKRNIYIMSFNERIIRELRSINKEYKYGVLNYILNSDNNYNYDFICLIDSIAKRSVIDSFQKRNIDVIIYATRKIRNNVMCIVDDYKKEKLMK